VCLKAELHSCYLWSTELRIWRMREDRKVQGGWVCLERDFEKLAFDS
jgi:hypothetical protein